MRHEKDVVERALRNKWTYIIAAVGVLGFGYLNYEDCRKGVQDFNVPQIGASCVVKSSTEIVRLILENGVDGAKMAAPFAGRILKLGAGLINNNSEKETSLSPSATSSPKATSFPDNLILVTPTKKNPVFTPTSTPSPTPVLPDGTERFRFRAVNSGKGPDGMGLVIDKKEMPGTVEETKLIEALIENCPEPPAFSPLKIGFSDSAQISFTKQYPPDFGMSFGLGINVPSAIAMETKNGVRPAFSADRFNAAISASLRAACGTLSKGKTVSELDAGISALNNPASLKADVDAILKSGQFQKFYQPIVR